MTQTAHQHPDEQADGHRDVPRRDNARSYLNTALQVLALGRPRVQMALGQQAAKDLEESIMKAIALLEPVRPAAPDPAFVEMAAAMEQTNRELGLTGDELIAQLETEARFGYASRCIECGKEFPVRSATDRLCARCYVEGKL